MKNWTLLVTGPAKNGLERLPEKDLLRLEQALDRLQDDPFGGDVKRLQPAGWRRRVGNYRIFYDVFASERRIVVTAIVRRTTTTY
jgi:mRNA-degrading endonuclease RelE of RelBE toxin-antitoxin system